MTIFAFSCMEATLFITLFLVILLLQKNISLRKHDVFASNFVYIIKRLQRSRVFKGKGKFIVGVTALVYIIAFIFIYSLIKVFFASLILSVPILLVPIIILKVSEIKEKNTIIKNLPIYAINLKNNIKSDNDVVLAIRRTKTSEILKKYIDVFVKDVDNGVSVYESFNRLDKAVAIKEFSDLIQTFQICYKTGGDFSRVLDIYSKQITEKILLREREHEKSLSTIITLVVMILLDIIMLFVYIPKNKLVLEIFSNNILGRSLIDINSVTVLLCMYFLFKIYKMEE